MKHVLLLYGLLLVVLLLSSVVREGFESSSPQAIKDMANKKVLLLVTMHGCKYCDQLKPIWDAVAAKHPDQMVAVEKDDPAAQDMLKTLNVKGYPAMFVMDHGKMVKTFDGRTEPEILAEVSSL